MNYLTYGNPQNDVLLFLHGMASTAELCYAPILPFLKDYYVVLVEVDGHSSRTNADLTDLASCIDDIETCVLENFKGHIYGISGISMGATMAVELIGRGNITVEKAHLDAAFLVKMGILTKPYEHIFSKAISMLQQGKKIPQVILNLMMGKGNTSVIDLLYQDVSKKTIINACEYVYTYEIPESIKEFKGPVVFWMGSNEPYPKKSARLLKHYLPQLKVIQIPNMGHCQFLHEQPARYANHLLKFLNS